MRKKLTEEEKAESWIKTKERVARWKREHRRKRGLQKCGRKENTEEQNILAKEKRKEWEKEWRTEYNKINPQKKLLWAAKKRAKEKNLPFNITEDDIIIPKVCPYLGIEFTDNAKRGTDRKTVMSLDRIIPELGYVKGNIEVISHRANTMKSASTKEELILFAKRVLEKFDDSKSSRP
jgi:hypothetical protein